MSRSQGSKRKAASLQGDDHVAEAAIIDGDDTINLAIDREIEREIAEIKAGRHPNLTESLESLARAKEKKIDAADRHRKMQINNINALYEYEVEDANALFKKAYLEVQEELIAELNSERSRQQLLFAEKEKSRRRANGAAAAAAVAASASSAPSTAPGGRSMRSSAAPGENGESAGSAVSNAYSKEYIYSRGGANGAGSSALSSSSSNGTKKRSSAPPSLDHVLPENSMRADFLEIVRDLHVRSSALEKTKAKALDKEVRLSGDLSELFIGDDSYSTGDLCTVFSVLSQENICGIITALSHRELVVRTATGVRFNVLVGQLRTGRVILSKDRDTAENAVVFQTAAEMQSVRDKYYKYSS
uniref:Uncharacterized protein n=1 Tax=Spumella elongata TaxID=89044 RepID=A0A7S3GR95_9STRA